MEGHISGLEQHMPFDRLYLVEPSQLMAKDFTFYGYQSSKIVHDIEDKNWKIEILSNSRDYAITNGSDPPLGTREYHLSESLGGGTVKLNLNSCDNNEEYNCDDGSCIPIEMKCDSVPDCVGGDDEGQCNKIEFPKSYIKSVPGTNSPISSSTNILRS